MIRPAYFLVLSLGIALLVTSCKTCEPVADPPSGNAKVDYEVVQSGVFYGDGQEGLDQGGIVIDGKVELQEFMEKANRVNETVSSIAIDFEKEQLLVYVDRVRPTAGFSIIPDVIYETNNVITVNMNLEKPEGMAAEVITQPFIILKIGKSGSVVQFNLSED